MRTEDQIKEASKILTDSAKPPTARDDEVWLADEDNQLKKLIPSWQNAEVREYERQVLLRECHERGMTAADVAELNARQVAKLHAETKRKQDNERLDRLVKSGSKAGRNNVELGGDILRSVGADRHRSGALR